jgi:hypothetical protein
MDGPRPRGFWTSALDPAGTTLLERGRRYTVVAAFTDYDGVRHAAGESWVFLAQNFMPYDDGLSLIVSLDGISEWHIRLQWRRETQGGIIDHLGDYVRPV